MYIKLKEWQEFNAQVHKSQATTFCVVVCDICESLVWNLLLSPFLHLEFWGGS
jgi:hypothetical protein